VGLRMGVGSEEHWFEYRVERDPKFQTRIEAARQSIKEGRGIRLGDVPPDTPATLLLDTLTGGAMMHALIPPADRRADLARNTGAYVTRLVDFLLRAVTPALPSRAGRMPTLHVFDMGQFAYAPAHPMRHVEGECRGRQFDD